MVNTPISCLIVQEYDDQPRSLYGFMIKVRGYKVDLATLLATFIKCKISPTRNVSCVNKCRYKYINLLYQCNYNIQYYVLLQQYYLLLYMYTWLRLIIVNKYVWKITRRLERHTIVFVRIPQVEGYQVIIVIFATQIMIITYRNYNL